MNTVRISLLAAATAFALCALPAHAQDSTADNDAETKASVPADRIADRYADSLFDGDEELAADTVESLRKGGDYTVKNADGTTSTIENTNGPMGYGEVNIALGMADKLVKDGDAETWEDALYGTADTTGSDGKVVEGTAGVLELRADGMGWGKIAKQLGFSLGSVMGKAPTRDATTTAKAERTARAEHAAKPERAAKPEHAAKPEKPERVAKVERVERPERVEKPTRPERPEKPERGGRP